MSIKKLVCAVLSAVLICFSLSGCDVFSTQADSLLSAPKLTGEMQPVQVALDEYITENYSLKFPTGGETRTAITLVDLNEDGVKEAIAFYSTSSDNTVTMHLAVIKNDNGKWSVVAHEKVVAGGVDRVYFKDMNNNGQKEIIVGWNVYGDIDKKVSVYDYSGNALISLLDEPYTTFLLCDLDDNFTDDLLTFNLDFTVSTAVAKYFSINSQGVFQHGSCQLDGNITSFENPVISTLSNGESCVYVDCIKGSGMITEVLFFKDNVLMCPLYDETLSENVLSYRPAIVPCRDYDNDGVIEIPVMSTLPTGENSSSSAYLTVWNSYNGVTLIAESYALMNYSDGYSVTLSKELAEKTTTIRNLEDRERIIYEYDYRTNTVGNEIFRVRVVSRSAYDSGIYKDIYTVLSIGEHQVWLASLKEKAAEYGITKENILNMFELITEG